jgi:hypothetical protein
MSFTCPRCTSQSPDAEENGYCGTCDEFTGPGRAFLAGSEPADRMTRLCGVMPDALEADPEYSETVQAVIMLRDGARGRTAFHGYDDGSAGVADAITHLQGVFEAHGSTLTVMPLSPN